MPTVVTVILTRFEKATSHAGMPVILDHESVQHLCARISSQVCNHWSNGGILRHGEYMRYADLKDMQWVADEHSPQAKEFGRNVATINGTAEASGSTITAQCGNHQREGENFYRC